MSAGPMAVGVRQSYDQLMRTPGAAWWRPVLGTILVFLAWSVAGAPIAAALEAIGRQTPGSVTWLGLLAMNLTAATVIPLSMLVARKFNHQTPGRLSSVDGRLRRRPLVWFGLAAMAVELLALLLIWIGGIDLIAKPVGVAPDAAAIITVTLLTTTLQAAGEEYFFRGYLFQAVGSIVRSRLATVVVTSVLFMFSHGVLPWESPALFADRFAFGLLAGYLVIRTGGLEASIAAHAANNIITFVVAALTNTVTASLSATDAPWPLTTVDIAKFVAFAAVAVVLACRWKLSHHADQATKEDSSSV